MDLQRYPIGQAIIIAHELYLGDSVSQTPGEAEAAALREKMQELWRPRRTAEALLVHAWPSARINQVQGPEEAYEASARLPLKPTTIHGVPTRLAVEITIRVGSVDGDPAVIARGALSYDLKLVIHSAGNETLHDLPHLDKPTSNSMLNTFENMGFHKYERDGRLTRMWVSQNEAHFCADMLNEAAHLAGVQVDLADVPMPSHT